MMHAKETWIRGGIVGCWRVLYPPVADVLGENWTLMHCGAPVHCSEHKKMCLENREIPILDWPLKSPDLKFFENVWGMMPSAVDKVGKKYQNVV